GRIHGAAYRAHDCGLEVRVAARVATQLSRGAVLFTDAKKRDAAVAVGERDDHLCEVSWLPAFVIDTDSFLRPLVSRRAVVDREERSHVLEPKIALGNGKDIDH